jgi:hypothetical protein
MTVSLLPSPLRAIIQACTIQIPIVPAAGTDVAAPWSKRLLGMVACLVGAHDWTDWQVRDPDSPGEQVRTCVRCSRQKTNAAPAPIDAWKMPLN